jgi:HEAT repeat protein
LLQHDTAVEVQKAAAQALAHYVLMAEWGEIAATMTPRIVEALLDVYEKPETAVSLKRAALEALGGATHPRVPTLIRHAYGSRQHDLQLSAVFAMGSSADKRWLPQILEALESDSDEIRIEAARAAGAIGATETLPQLAHLAVDDNLEIALAVVEALGQIGGDVAYKMLLQMSEDADFLRLHDAVDEALEEIDWLGGGSFDMLHFSEGDGMDDDNGRFPHDDPLP